MPDLTRIANIHVQIVMDDGRRATYNLDRSGWLRHEPAADKLNGLIDAVYESAEELVGFDNEVED